MEFVDVGCDTTETATSQLALEILKFGPRS